MHPKSQILYEVHFLWQKKDKLKEKIYYYNNERISLKLYMN